MDISEKYINMVNCPEIQELWQPIYFKDTVFNKKSKTILQFPIMYLGTINTTSIRKVFIFLPNQEWFQEQLCAKPTTEYSDLSNEGFTSNSFEQLWCQLFMYKKYKKIWINDINMWT
jgi:hypothetical protein